MFSRLRETLQPFRRLLAWPFLKLGASPAFVGAVGIALCAAAALSFRAGCPRLAFWLAVLGLLTDMIDGEVARGANASSPEGNYLDALGDRLSECLLLLGLLPSSPNLVCLAMAGGCLTSYAKARCAQVRIMDNRDWPGVGDYPDRAALLLTAYVTGGPYAWIPLGVLVLVTWSCLAVRARYARRLIREATQEELLPYLRRDGLT